jgi:hypothetical protein
MKVMANTKGRGPERTVSLDCSIPSRLAASLPAWERTRGSAGLQSGGVSRRIPQCYESAYAEQAKKQPSYRFVVAAIQARATAPLWRRSALYNPLTDPPTIRIDEQKARD